MALIAPPLRRMPLAKKAIAGATAAAKIVAAPKAAGAGYNGATNFMSQKQLSSGALDSMIQQNSPYLQRARTGAMQYGANRGLLNSSMTAGAGEAAAIGAAQPFAMQDSNMLLQQGLANQSSINQSRQFGASSRNTANLANQAAALDVAARNQAAQNTSRQFNAANATETSMFNAGAANTNALNQFNANAGLMSNFANNQAAMARDAQSQTAAGGLARIDQAGAMSRAAMASADAATQTYQELWNQIQSAPTSQMSAAVKTQMMTQLNNIHQQRLNAANVLSGVQLNWAVA